MKYSDSSESYFDDSASILAGVDLVLAIDRTGSATKAAKQLHTTTATVLRRLEQLEAQLGTQLFDRGARGLRATEAMSLVRPWAEQAEAAAAGMLREITRTERKPAGVVRLAVTPVVATLFVVPALPSFRAAFPEIVIELVPATAVVDLAMREADLAVRTTRPEKGDLVAQRLAGFPLVVVRSPKLQMPRHATRLDDLPWLAWDRSLSHIPEARWITSQIQDSSVVFRCSELSPLVAAVQEGIGVTVMAEPVARRAGLVQVDLPTPVMPVGDVWLVAHSALRPVPRVAAVWDWIVAAFKTPLPKRPLRSKKQDSLFSRAGRPKQRMNHRSRAAGRSSWPRYSPLDSLLERR